ncbi:hypothetical protein C8R46DRAFT_1230897 [Mycena filopes]|nr:hypothetical protein C8R46DRAFT_1230897 [Mycena filopes]
MLRETTLVGNDGRIRNSSTLVPVPASPQKKLTADDYFLLDSAPLEAEGLNSAPQFEREGGLHSDVDDDGDDGPRELRDSDDPLGQWVRENRAEFLELLLLLEGRGVHASESFCPSCPEELREKRGKPEYRCRDCMAGGQLVCKACLVEHHKKLSLHRIQRWSGRVFEKVLLKELGLRIQLGHWEGRRTCTVPDAAAGDDFVIVHDHVHQVTLPSRVVSADHYGQAGFESKVASVRAKTM